MSKGISFFTSKYMKSNVNFALGRKNVRISEQIMSAGKYRCKQSLKYICSRAIGVIALRDRISTKWYSLVFKPRFYWNNRVRLKFNSRSESVKLLLQKKVHACLFIKSYQRTLKSTHSLQQNKHFSLCKNIWRIINTTASIWRKNIAVYLSLTIMCF